MIHSGGHSLPFNFRLRVQRVRHASACPPWIVLRSTFNKEAITVIW